MAVTSCLLCRLRHHNGHWESLGSQLTGNGTVYERPRTKVDDFKRCDLKPYTGQPPRAWRVEIQSRTLGAFVVAPIETTTCTRYKEKIVMNLPFKIYSSD